MVISLNPRFTKAATQGKTESNLEVVSPPNSRKSFACSSRILATTVDDYVDVLNVLNLFDVQVTQGQRKERQPQ